MNERILDSVTTAVYRRFLRCLGARGVAPVARSSAAMAAAASDVLRVVSPERRATLRCIRCHSGSPYFHSVRKGVATKIDE